MLDEAWGDPQKHILMLSAWGGVGKTALVSHWINSMEGEHYAGAARVYGWSFYSQGTREDRQASGDAFLAHALEWFGDPDPKEGAPWEKGVRLAGVIQKQRTLLILDGLEPLQEPSEMRGRLRDPGVQGLLKELARAGTDWGLCVISTRLAVAELTEMKDTSVKQVALENLSDQDSAKLLRTLGVTKGTDEELKEAAREFKCHALALTLLGRYLAVVHDGEIRKRDLVPLLEQLPEERGRHARRVMKSYEVWLKGKPELDVLNLLGLFDRPASGGAMLVLRREPIIKGLTDNVCYLTDVQWKFAVEYLRDLHLLASKDETRPEMLDCHPLVREHFGAALKDASPTAWQEAHGRLYFYFKGQPQKLYGRVLPDTLAEMEPLFRAVAHGCQAGRHQETLDQVFVQRICRGNEAFVVHKLGAFGAGLAALSGFFEVPWSQPVPGLTDDDKGWVLNSAGYSLRGLGRLREARQPMKASLEAEIAREHWKRAAVVAGNLTEICLTLGEVTAGVKYGRQGVELADRSGAAFQRLSLRADLAHALHQAGDLPGAEKLFREAEGLQQEDQPEFPLLYSLQGYQFCDLLLSQGRFQQVQERAKKTLEWVTSDPHAPSLTVAVEYLSLARAALGQAQGGEPSTIQEAARHLNQAVQALREADLQEFLALGLLARAGLHRVTSAFAEAWKDLTEAREIAERGEMKLYLTDYHLEAARLSLAEGEKDQAREHLATAREMIEEMGYGRRKGEVEELVISDQ